MKVKRKSFVYFRLRCRLRSGLPTDKLLHHMTGRHIYTFPGRVKYKCTDIRAENGSLIITCKGKCVE